jgi:hypothetical protein
MGTGIAPKGGPSGSDAIIEEFDEFLRVIGLLDSGKYFAVVRIFPQEASQS